MKKIFYHTSIICAVISAILAVFFFVKMMEEKELLKTFISDAIGNKSLINREDTVITVSKSIYERTGNWVTREEMDWYSEWEATGFFKMSTGVSLKYNAFGVTGHPNEGPCGTMTKNFLNAMWELDIPARKLQLHEAIKGKGGHTMAEFFYNGKWRVISPSDNAFIWRNKDSSIATVNDIRTDTSVFNQVYYKWKPGWPYGFQKTANINWEKLPSFVTSVFRFFLSKESFENAETPELYEQPRKLFFISFSFLIVVFLLTAFLFKKN